MTTFLQPDDAGIESGTKRGQNKRGQNRAACFLHLRDLVYLHPKAASADAIAFVQSLEAAVIAEKATREKQLAEARERAERAEGRREADRVKAAAGESEDRARPRAPPLGSHKATSRVTLGTTGGDGGGYQVRFNTRSRSMTKSSLRISSRVSSIVCCDWRIASRVSATISAVRRAIASPSGDRAKPGRHSISNNPLLARSFRERLY